MKYYDIRSISEFLSKFEGLIRYFQIHHMQQSLYVAVVFGFFIIGGALFAILTTLVAITINYSRVLWGAVDDGLFPKWFKATNRYRVPHRIIILMGFASVVPIAFNISLTYMFSLMVASWIFVGLLAILPILIAPNKLPERFKNAWFRVQRN